MPVGAGPQRWLHLTPQMPKSYLNTHGKTHGILALSCNGNVAARRGGTETIARLIHLHSPYLASCQPQLLFFDFELFEMVPSGDLRLSERT